MNWIQERLDLESGIFDYTLFSLAGTPVTVATLIVFFAIVGATFLISFLIQKALIRAMNLRKVSDAGTLEVARRLLHYLIVASGLAVGLQTIGINLSALFAAGAVFAIGLGFAMQNIMQNFVSGVILLTERTMKPGDVLAIDQRLVRVQKMGIRATIARTRDEEDIIIPNAAIVQGNVTNYTMSDSLYRLRANVGVVYSADMRQVKEVLEKAAAAIKQRSSSHPPQVLLTAFGNSSVDWEISIWIDDPWRSFYAKAQLNEAIWWGLKEADITIAFPQLDVHFDPPFTEAMRRVG